MKIYQLSHQGSAKMFFCAMELISLRQPTDLCVLSPNSSNRSQFCTVISRMLLLCRKQYTLASPKLKTCYCLSVLPNKLHNGCALVCLSINKDANLDVPSYQLLFCRTRKQLIIPEAPALFWIWQKLAGELKHYSSRDSMAVIFFLMDLRNISDR